MPRVLLLGGGGQVGRQVAAQLGHRGEVVELTIASRSSSDPESRIELERPETIARIVDRLRPDHTILTAAATNVAWCEAHPVESRLVNVDGTTASAAACHAVGSSLTFISTDYVFDGSSGPYGEASPPGPINEYGRQKLAAEQAVLDDDDRNLVIRTCQVFGPDARRLNFVVRVVDELRNGRIVEAPDDLFGTPTFASDLAAALVQLTLDGATGLWHVAGESYLSRYELAVAAATAFQLDASLIRVISADTFKDAVRRPRLAGLRNDRMHEEGFGWVTPLDRALEQLRGEEAR